MSEMAMKLKRRKQMADGEPGPGGDTEPPAPPAPAPAPSASPDVRRPWAGNTQSQGRTTNGSESQSPKPARKSGPDSTATNGSVASSSSGGGGGGGGDLEAFKVEMMAEMRREMAKMKVDIIEAIRQE